MSDAPIRDFLQRMQTFDAVSQIVLLWMVALQETAQGGSGLVSPYAETGKGFPLEGISEEETKAAFKRLCELGEVEYVETEQWRGYRVKRFEEFQASLADFGRRAYFRQRAQERKTQTQSISQ